MKNILSKTCAIMLGLMMSVSVCLLAGGCSPESTSEEIDPNRTQLYVFNYAGGFGSDWLQAVKERYEEYSKDVVYEEGKTGVQIFVTNQKSTGEDVAGTVLTNHYEVYFTEYAYYQTLRAQGVLGDITEAVTGDLSVYDGGDAEGATIEGKLTDEQRAYYGVQDAQGQVHYYGIPHYSGYTGLIYNVDLFNERNFYFRDEPTGDTIYDRFVRSSSDKKSAGPDGKHGTYDDGLPATYEEFFILLQYISRNNVTPMVWTGANYKDYLNNFVQALVADYEGLDQMMLNFTMDGSEATDLGTINGDGLFVPDGEGTAITEENGYEIMRQAGKYYAIDFLEELVTTDSYHHDLAINRGFTHLDAQNDFLYGGKDNYTKPIAILLDGIWWESEANQTFLAMEATDSANSKYNRNFAFMPLPKAPTSENDKITLFDHIYSMCFMKANIAEYKRPLAIDFIKFVNTQESLVEFTQITDTPKALNYTMKDTQKQSMSPFGRSLINMRERAEVVYPIATNSTYVNHQAQFSNEYMYYSATGAGTYGWIAEALIDASPNVTAADYFAGLYEYRKDNWLSW